MIKVLNILSVCALIAMVFLPVTYFFQLPETIPIHFDAEGNPDNYGSRYSVFMLPIIGIALFLIFRFLDKLITRKTQLFDFPEKYNKEQTKLALNFTVVIKCLLLVFIAYLTFATLQVSLGNWSGLGDYVMWFLTGSLLLLISAFLYRFY